MTLREWVPRWWSGRAGSAGAVANVLLAPAELAYRGAIAARNGAYDRHLLRATRAPIPVVSVGNLAVGGSGKTPVAAWLAGRLQSLGRRPAIALRGYGADEVEVHRTLNPDVPVFADARRAAAVGAAAEAGCDCAVLDDAFQHRSLLRDLDLLLVPVEGWSDRPRLLPRGPWREPQAAIGRADLVLVTRKAASEDARDAVMFQCERLGARAVAACHIRPTQLRPMHEGRRIRRLEWLRGRSVLAVAGVGTPEGFVRQLESTGAAVEPMLFPDHHAYTAEDAEMIRERAGQRTVVTTLKDAVKLRTLLGPEVPTWVLHQTVHVELGEDLLQAGLDRALEAPRA